MEKVLNLTYASSLTDLCEVNSSFDAGVLRVAYPGENRNKSNISKEAFEKNIKTMYNCPIVCNYDRETDELGGHDMEVVRDADGALSLVNLTTPVGCIPESAKHWWGTVEEEDGTTHEYLYVEALLWKRQEAYRKIKKDGITAHSMEITVKDGETKDGVFYIYDFEFTAFTLIGVTPCFESSALQMFSQKEFKQQLTEMMHELKECFSKVDTSDEDDNIHPQNNYSTEGGEKVLDEKMELLAEFGFEAAGLDFSLDDFTIEELRAKFESMAAKKDEGENDSAEKGTTESGDGDKFALTGNLIEEIARAISEYKVQREWGECRRYCYVDCDFEAQEVYCWDTTDWLLYGFKYELNGDNVIIDLDSRVRKKYVIVDFDEGEQPSPIAPVFEEIEQKLTESAAFEEKYRNASDTIASMETELGELRQFKTDTEFAIAEGKRKEIFAQFDELDGVEAFEQLKENAEKYDLETLEEKCYAIKGRNGVPAKFGFENKAPKIVVDKVETTDEPYGGIMQKYGIGTED